MLTRLDDFLIDYTFQPICDALRKLFGWSKEAPMGIATALVVIGYTPICADMINHGNPITTMGWLLALWLLLESWLAIHLIQKGVKGKDSEKSSGTAAMNSARIIMRPTRIGTLVLSLLCLLTIFPIIFVPEISLFTLFLSIGIIANVCSAYFQACTDLPPGKTILAKAKEWLAEHFAKPIVTPG